MPDGSRHPRILRFLESVAAAIPCVPDDDATRAELRACRDENLLGIYLNYFGRFVPTRPRQIVHASAFWTPAAFRLGGDIVTLEGKILRGQNLDPHLSPNIGRNGFVQDGRRRRWEPVRDITLNAFGTHHLHLIPGGSNALVFIAFSKIEARFIMVGDHRSFDDGSLANAVAHFHVEIGATSAALQPPANPTTPRDQMRLARHGTSSLGTAAGKVTVGPSIMSNGDAFRTRRYADHLMDRVETINPLLDDRAWMERAMPEAIRHFGETVDLSWEMYDTDLTLFENVSGTMCTVAPGFC